MESLIETWDVLKLYVWQFYIDGLVGLIETWDVLKLSERSAASVFRSSFNRNMGCIEIVVIFPGGKSQRVFNRNMGCIEIALFVLQSYYSQQV